MDDSARLRTLAAELRSEVSRIDRCVAELRAARGASGAVTERLALYGIAALLDTFYTGVEKALTRISAVFGGMPGNPAWHRALLETMVLDVPKVRPAVLREATACRLERYLAFRHRFRNLYLFDLDADLTTPLLDLAPDAWHSCRTDLLAFADQLEQIADTLTR